MSVALNDSLHGGRLWRALQTQALVDASFVVAHRGHGRFDIARLIGASVPQWVGWVSGTAAGLLAAPSPQLMHALGADVTFPAFFLVPALDEIRRSRRAIVAAATGACIAAVLLFVTTPGQCAAGRHPCRAHRRDRAPRPAQRARRAIVILWLSVLTVTIANWAMKASGPLALGARQLPPAVGQVTSLIAPVPLAGLIVIELGGASWSDLN